MAPALPRSSSVPVNNHQSPWRESARPHATSFHSARVRGSSEGSSTALSSDLQSGYSSHRHPTAVNRLSSRRPVNLSDRRLVAIANETAAMIQWDPILRGVELRQARWRWSEDHGPFSLFTRHDSQRAAVLAVGVVNASVAELASLLQSHGPNQHVQRMEALFGDQVKHGAHVYDVDLSSLHAGWGDGTPLPLPVADDGAMLAQLSVKTATFQRSKMLSSHEQWCFADAVYKHPTNGSFERHLTSLRPKDVLVGKSSGKTKAFHDVVCGYCVQPEPAPEEGAEGSGQVGVASRVHFYAELFTPKHFGVKVPNSTTALSERAIRRRLVQLAQACARLPQLVRRRRLGVQVLVDSTRLFPPTNVACVVCSKHLLVAKLCRLCGHGVCDDCSRKHERERAVPGSDRLRIENVRVCTLCMRRVDAADYAYLGDSDAALMPAHVTRDPVNAKSASAALTALLQEALMSATTAKRKASVLNVIKCVLDQETQTNDPLQKPKKVTLTESSTEKDYMRALVDLEVPTVPSTTATVAETTGRTYAVDPTAPVDTQMAFPAPDNEEQRLKAIQDTHIRELGHSEELSLICEMASREMDCFATLVTIVDQEELYIAASNVASLELQSFARNDAFCSHMVMTGNPLIVPHPEADVRFHQCLPVKMLGTKYYCGFPVVAGDEVIGAMCCVDVKSRELSESQYTYLTKLADTAGKLVTLHAEETKRSLLKEPDEPQHAEQMYML